MQLLVAPTVLPSLFDEENTPPAANDDQKQAASNFLEDYKLDVVKGANLKHDIDEGHQQCSLVLYVMLTDGKAYTTTVALQSPVYVLGFLMLYP